jgi:hypothetical protein
MRRASNDAIKPIGVRILTYLLAKMEYPPERGLVSLDGRDKENRHTARKNHAADLAELPDCGGRTAEVGC